MKSQNWGISLLDAKEIFLGEVQSITCHSPTSNVQRYVCCLCKVENDDMLVRSKRHENIGKYFTLNAVYMVWGLVRVALLDKWSIWWFMGLKLTDSLALPEDPLIFTLCQNYDITDELQSSANSLIRQLMKKPKKYGIWTSFFQGSDSNGWTMICMKSI